MGFRRPMIQETENGLAPVMQVGGFRADNHLWWIPGVSVGILFRVPYPRRWTPVVLFVMKNLDPTTPFRTAGALAIQAQCRKLERTLPGAISGSDPEDLRKLRIATRRLRAILKVFRSCMPPACYQSSYRLLTDLAHTLGRVRDLDVQSGIVTSLRSDLPEMYQCDMDPWITDQEMLRGIAFSQLVVTLNRWLVEDTISHLRGVAGVVQGTRAGEGVILPHNGTGGLHVPQATSGKSGSLLVTVPHASLRENAALPILVRLERVVRYDKDIRDPSHVEELHDMRIAVKWLRYTLEIFAVAVADGQAFLRTLKRLQFLLGQVHDTDVLLSALDENAAEERLPIGLQVLRDGLVVQRSGMYDDFVREWDVAVAEGLPIRLWNEALAASSPEDAPARWSLPKSRLLPAKRVRRSDMTAALHHLVDASVREATTQHAHKLQYTMDLVDRSAGDPDVKDREWRIYAGALCDLLAAPSDHH